MHELLQLSALELAALLRARKATSREVVDVHIAHVQKVNPTINAVVADRFEVARAEADAADTRLAAGDADLPPLHGVPCTIKESFALAGMPNSSGLVARRDVIATEDATTVARLRAAGAIPIGVTNVSELCLWMETNNRVYGRSNNPYEPGRIVGGSSGGEGAIVGAGGSPFGLGADIGGSIRMPAFFNGVFGHKPTGGLVPGTGQYPIAENAALRYLCSGPIARRAGDLMPLLQILAGPDGRDQRCGEFELGDPAAVKLDELMVFDIRGNGRTRVSEDLLDAQTRVAGFLAERGARVHTIKLAALKRSLDIWSSMMHLAADTPFARLLGNGKTVYAVVEIMRWMVRRSPYTLPAIALVALERLNALLEGRTRRFAALGQQLRLELIDRVGPKGILLYPSYPTPAPRHYRPLMPPFNWVYTAILNVMEIPVTQCPLGLNAQGLPLGVQVGALHGNDHMTIAVAMEIERAFGGWVPPPIAVAQ